MSEQFPHGKDVARRVRRQQHFLRLRLAAQVLHEELTQIQAAIRELLATEGRPPLTLDEARLVRELRQHAAHLRVDLQVVQDEFAALRETDE
jgi:hypothetical protein